MLPFGDGDLATLIPTTTERPADQSPETRRV
jgi:hypothetical protein